IVAFYQHHAGGGAQVTAHGGQRHGVGLGYFAADGFFQPLVELLKGVGVRCAFVQFGAFVAFAEVGNRGHGLSIGTQIKRHLA
ncbi:MAG: hypothetical protein RLZ68_1391, partial [Pseudomonadota bacterium]